MQNYLEFIGNELKALTSIPSPSGYTKDVAAYLMKTLSDMGYEPQLSNKGNVFVTIGGEGNPLVLAAHVDTLGAMVRSVKANGRLRPTTLGGHQWSTADGENCTIQAFKKGFMEAGPVLLEPIASVKVTVPDDYTGDVMGDLNKRRGRVLGMNPQSGGYQVIEADVPMTGMFGYCTTLRSMTGGRGSYSYEFARYEQAPADVQEKEIEKRAAEE